MNWSQQKLLHSEHNILLLIHNNLLSAGGDDLPRISIFLLENESMIAEGESSVRVVVGGNSEAENVSTTHSPTTVSVKKAEHDFLYKWEEGGPERLLIEQP